MSHLDLDDAAARAALQAELDALIYFVTHDLKNPLSAVMGYAGMLSENVEQLSLDQIRRSAEIIYLACAKMNDQIADLHALARVRKLDQVVCQPLDMAQIVADVSSLLHDQIAASHAEIVYPASWPEARGFAPWVEDIWLHYLSNAIQHGCYPADQPPQIELGATVQADRMIRYWVRDYGPGIAPEMQAKLFVSFEQIDKVSHATRGLGLALVRRIVDRLAGSVGVESSGVPGEGSLFYFTLPAE
ncbi:MAG: HAMP domain-containing histidine kinase [Anaerolineae bacterium]|nr:HAMP domain-containing histidine kinase [Anaerolineae bacterium]